MIFKGIKIEKYADPFIANYRSMLNSNKVTPMAKQREREGEKSHSQPLHV